MVRVRQACIVVILLCFGPRWVENQKAADAEQQPRIITQDGHLIFQTGAYHNISFQASHGGYVILAGYDIKNIVEMVRQTKKDLDQMKTARLPERLQAVESKLEGEVLHQLNEISTQLATLNRKVTQLERRNNSRLILPAMRKLRVLNRKVTHLTELLTRNECSSHPCRNGGVCVDHYNGFSCQCLPAWQAPLCDTDVNECATLAGTDLGCQNGATCINTHGSFRCVCAANWNGIRCSESHDDCTGVSHEALCGHGACVNLERITPGQPKFHCICENGWKKESGGQNAACTVDVDECSGGGASVCSSHPPVQCINIPGSFRCANCPTGFTGNGHVCHDVDECATNNGGCSRRVQCTNTAGSRRCGACPSGLEGDGIECHFVGICHVNNGGCHVDATCREAPGIITRTCTCPSGSVGSGVGPTGCAPDTSACRGNPCHHGICYTTQTSYICACDPGYNGSNCETRDPCISSPCKNGATCLPVGSHTGHTCICTSGYTGPTCEQQLEDCGGRYQSDTGSITFPEEHGAMYDDNIQCVWVISVAAGKNIELRFLSFHLEEDVGICRYDSLQVRDGESVTAPLIGRYCGGDLPGGGAINSTGNQVYLRFESDVSITYDGFQLHWNAVNPACGGLLEGSDSGTISSPSFPLPYAPGVECVWTVVVSQFNMIRFTASSLPRVNCSELDSDYVTIQDGRLSRDPVIGLFCVGSNLRPTQTTGRYARVMFHSGASSHQRKAFQIHFSPTPAAARCGGTIHSSSGVISSPQPSVPNAICSWSILSQDGNRLNLTFDHLSLPYDYGCHTAYVELRDGANESANIVGSYCGDRLPPPFVSSRDAVWLKFVNGESRGAIGFRARFVAVCGGRFSSEVGEIKSPHFPDSYSARRRCVYVIDQPEGSTVILNFQTFDVGARTADGCMGDYVELRLGDSDSAAVYGKWCGSMHIPPIILQNNVLRLTFVSAETSDDSGQGFLAVFSRVANSLPADGSGNRRASADPGMNVIHTCGGILTTPHGVFTSPSHPGNYPHGVNCTWYIMVSPGSVVRLTFNVFILQRHDRCLRDHVDVYDNYMMTSSSRVGRFCGNQMPPAITSSSNVLTVNFVSDRSVSHEGFAVSYVSINSSSVCGYDLTTGSGVIESPNYPQPYSRYSNCEWHITLQGGMQIRLNVTDFHMDESRGCQYDYLEIRDGGYSSSPLIGRYCGTTIDEIIRSQSNRLYLRMKTWFSRPLSGFSIQYHGARSGCGGEMTAKTGSFVTPNYPYQYDNAMDCDWRISVAAGSVIQLVFMDFDVVYSQHNCNGDFVEVRETSRSGRLLGRFCGTDVPAMVTSTSNQMFVIFHSDAMQTSRGFSASYHADCNNRLTSFRGAIESPNYPQPYPMGANCVWIIETTIGNTINASFSRFETVSHGACRDDYLEVRNGAQPGSPLIGRYCGMDLPPNIATNGSALYLKFVSDGRRAEAGFRMEYIVDGCGGLLDRQNGTFSSPHYPHPFSRARECFWTIAVARGYRIQLTIEDVDLEQHVDCAFGVLQVFGGEDDTYPQLTRICHTQSTPQQITSTGRYLYVRFKAGALRTGKGFSASYAAVPGGCGGAMTTLTGTILSPNYPSAYPDNLYCSWLITVRPGRTVVLTFDDFKLHPEPHCSKDYVALYDGDNVRAPQLTRVCGDTLPQPTTYTSSNNTMLVKMRSDLFESSRGFKASYAPGCGGYLSAATSGAVESPGWPGNYEKNLHCVWTIYAGRLDGRINIHPLHVDLGNCDGDYLLMYNGRRNDSKEQTAMHYCGGLTPSSVTTDANTVTLVFITDDTIERTGFRFLYSTSTDTCGGEMTSETGFVTTPYFRRFSSNYDLECVWTIRAPPGNKVQFAIRSARMAEDDALCNLGYVEVRDGWEGGRLVARVCNGRTFPPILLERVWIRLWLTANITQSEFAAEYAKQYGGILSGDGGRIASPHFPRSYHPDTDVTWNIITDLNKLIQVEFLQLAIPEGGAGCVDYVMLRWLESSVERKICGFRTDLPAMTTDTNTLEVSFHSSDRHLGGVNLGFMLRWTAVPLPANGTTGATNASQGSRLLATDRVQTLVSPGYPDGYENEMSRTWWIRTDPTHRIWISITDLRLERSQACAYDSLRLTGVTGGTGSLMERKMCTMHNMTEMLSRSSLMSIHFQTDSSVTDVGFSLDYKKVCGGLVETPYSGRLVSPGYPDAPYLGGAHCDWRLAFPGRTVQLRFIALDLGPNSASGCGDDYVEVLNGDGDGPPLGRGRYCGNAVVDVPDSSGGDVTIRYRCRGGRGRFALRYDTHVESCGGHVTLPPHLDDVFVTSPLYPNSTPENVECVWVVRSTDRRPMQINLVGSERLAQDTRCSESVILDGTTANARQLATFCDVGGSTIKATGHSMYIRLRTTQPMIGFKFRFSRAKCGGVIVATGGAILSPGYPSSYPNNVDCRWFVRAPVGHYLSFNVESIDIDGTFDCPAHDFLTIHDGNATGVSLRTLCGHNVPLGPAAAINSSDNSAVVHFHSDSAGTGSGFKLTFISSVESCGGQLFMEGTFHSPNHPGKYPNMRTCTWYLYGDPNRRITLTIDDLDLSTEDNRCDDSITVYDGPWSSSLRITEPICGVELPDVIQSSGSVMKVTLSTDASWSGRGFSASFHSDEEAVCGGVMPMVSRFRPGFLVSPPSGNGSAPRECSWMLLNDAGNSGMSVVLTFEYLEGGDSRSCSTNYVELREGHGPDGNLIGRYCENSTAGQPIVTLARLLEISYISHANSQFKFKLHYEATACGGLLTSPSGVITAPDIGGSISQLDTRCMWLISLPEGSQITVSFAGSTTDNETVLELFNGGLPMSPSMGRYLNGPKWLPAVLTTQSNQLRISFQGRAGANTHFALLYAISTGCGGLLHGLQGLIQSPNHPKHYPANVECIWDIEVPVGYHVLVTFNLPFDLQIQSTCDGDYVEVSGADTLLLPSHRYCGNEMPPRIESQGRSLSLTFRSDADISGRGFSANYTAVCGNTFTSSSGNLYSPGYPNPYANGLRCGYLIVNDVPEQHIMVTFSDLQLEYSPRGTSCSDDYIKIYAGNDTSGRLIRGPFCHHPPSRIISRESIYIELVTDGENQFRGFSANFSTYACGGKRTDSIGEITSIDHPGKYASNYNCTWVIEVDPDRIVRLKFTSFDLEMHRNCVYDYVEVRDGDSPSSPLIGRFCGHVAPDVIRSTGFTLSLTFVTDSTVALKGFVAAYDATYGSAVGCGGFLNGTAGSFSSLDESGNGFYEPNLYCVWEIITAENTYIQLHFQQFDLYPQDDLANQTTECRETGDYLEMHDGMFVSTPLIGRLCGATQLTDFTSRYNRMSVTFVSDGENSAAGFRATYLAMEISCGGVLHATNDTAELTSPYYPEEYPTNLHCTWIIDAPESQTVHIIFSELWIGTHYECVGDYLMIEDVSTRPEKRTLHFCGISLPPAFTSIERTAHITFVTDSESALETGFKLAYRITSCNRTYTGETGQLFSPGWPAPYPDAARCFMTVAAPAGLQLAFFFLEMDIEMHSHCRYDFLRIYNGTSDDSAILATVCGHSIPRPVFTDTNEVKLSFFSDGSIGRKGYVITYLASPVSGCGGTLRSVNGSFASPGYPGNGTVAAVACTWLIEVPVRRRVTLRFTDFEVGAATAGCVESHVDVHNGATASASRVGRYCGGIQPAEYTSTSNSLFITYTAAARSSGIGFRLIYFSH